MTTLEARLAGMANLAEIAAGLYEEVQRLRPLASVAGDMWNFLDGQTGHWVDPDDEWRAQQLIVDYERWAK